LRDCGARLLVTVPEQLEKATAAAEHAGVEEIFVYGEAAGATPFASLLEPDECLPAPGQGALAIECRTDRRELVTVLEALGDRATTLATTAERAFSRALGGSCQLPLAAYAEWEEGSLWLRGLVANREGNDVVRGEMDADVADAEGAIQLGRDLADNFLARGASRFLSP